MIVKHQFHLNAYLNALYSMGDCWQDLPMGVLGLFWIAQNSVGLTEPLDLVVLFRCSIFTLTH